MVDVKLLMVGDWVLLNGEPKQVMEILFGSITIDCYPIEEYYIEPIPLTEEILAKNFTLKIHGYQVCDCWKIWANPNYGYILATLVMDEFGGGSYEPCQSCRYVHELQQFLKLKHEEKEVVI